ncbi:hypothetical protein [Paenibacillus protaetiae]|uniref:Uncharacterized protein n=1 Tax=Paenibacillus protaetiae TaxID=2509456 RepID=A0A4P6ETW1_9BACL|nr:hypothetical protein [Paenibacillus protaetiae]QAY66372.1 hypothetical protein ET464_08075 [Paenibacillus protaetiae]
MVYYDKREFSKLILEQLLERTSKNALEWSYSIKYEKNENGPLFLRDQIDSKSLTIEDELLKIDKEIAEKYYISHKKSYFCRYNYSESLEVSKFIRISLIYLNANEENINDKLHLVCHREHKEKVIVLADSSENEDLKKKLFDLHNCIKLKTCKEFKILDKMLLNET